MFHFLTVPSQRDTYRWLLRSAVEPGGAVVVGAFAADGPGSCSGLAVQQYDPDDLVAGSIALVGFGVDSYAEVFAGAVVLWRLSKEAHGAHISAQAERRAVKLIAATFFLLAAGVLVESLRKLITSEHPSSSPLGMAITALSLIVMPLLARAKRQAGEQLGPRAVEADAAQSMLCVWLSAIVLAGHALNFIFGWWWRDPIAALGVVYIAGREGVEYWNSERVDDCC